MSLERLKKCIFSTSINRQICWLLVEWIAMTLFCVNLVLFDLSIATIIHSFYFILFYTLMLKEILDKNKNQEHFIQNQEQFVKTMNILFKKRNNMFKKTNNLFKKRNNLFKIRNILFKTINIYIYILLVCLSVCLFVSNKRQNGWIDRAQALCENSCGPREGLWMIKISKICLHQNSIFIKFLKIKKIHEFFVEIRELFFV